MSLYTEWIDAQITVRKTAIGGPLTVPEQTLRAVRDDIQMFEEIRAILTMRANPPVSKNKGRPFQLLLEFKTRKERTDFAAMMRGDMAEQIDISVPA